MMGSGCRVAGEADGRDLVPDVRGGGLDVRVQLELDDDDGDGLLEKLSPLHAVHRGHGLFQLLGDELLDSRPAPGTP